MNIYDDQLSIIFDFLSDKDVIAICSCNKHYYKKLNNYKYKGIFYLYKKYPVRGIIVNIWWNPSIVNLEHYWEKVYVRWDDFYKSIYKYLDPTDIIKFPDIEVLDIVKIPTNLYYLKPKYFVTFHFGLFDPVIFFGKKNMIHNDNDEPSIIYYNDNNNVVMKYWHKYNYCHRWFKPAGINYSNGDNYYYLYGMSYLKNFLYLGSTVLSILVSTFISNNLIQKIGLFPSILVSGLINIGLNWNLLRLINIHFN